MTFSVVEELALTLYLSVYMYSHHMSGSASGGTLVGAPPQFSPWVDPFTVGGKTLYYPTLLV